MKPPPSTTTYSRTVQASEAELLLQHCPVLAYDSQGSFYADSAAIMTDRVSADGKEANALKRADGTIVANANAASGAPRLELDFLGARKYANGAIAEAGDFLDAVGKDYVLAGREMHRPPYGDVVHGHVAVDADDARWLQYWFFYYWNDKAFLGFGLHEGDWEMVQIRLDTAGRPREMTFAQHTHGQRCAWSVVEKQGERPVVFVARGSQASYPRAGRHDAPLVDDVADGKGRRVSPRVEVLRDRAPRWLGWAGRWGSTHARWAPESQSPTGPRRHGQWNDPLAFHEDAVVFDPRRAAALPPPPAPAPPRIEAHREGAHATIRCRFRRRSGDEPRAVQVVISVDSPEDDLPPATYAFPVEAADMTITHPLVLEDRAYVVRASAADDSGHTSETVEAALEP
jgi:hypothetical protein